MDGSVHRGQLLAFDGVTSTVRFQASRVMRNCLGPMPDEKRQVLEFSIQKILERPLRIQARASGGSCETRCQRSECPPDSDADETG